jgi:hypothetical protein
VRNDGSVASVTGAVLGLVAGMLVGLVLGSTFHGGSGDFIDYGSFALAFLVTMILAGVGSAAGSGVALRVVGQPRAVATSFVALALAFVEIVVVVLEVRLVVLLPALLAANGAWARWVALRRPESTSQPAPPLPEGAVRAGPAGIIGRPSAD